MNKDFMMLSIAGILRISLSLFSVAAVSAVFPESHYTR